MRDHPRNRFKTCSRNAWMALVLACGAVGAMAQAQVQINQVGFTPSSAKWAVAPDGEARTFAVIDDKTGRTVLRGDLGLSATWAPAAQSARLIDLTALSKPGRYRVRVDGAADSAPFTVAGDAYAGLTAAAIRAFYFNRASIAITPSLAKAYARPAGHPDTRVLIHASAASPDRPEGTVISSPKGWYDAGDYNKYIVNSGISVYTLLAAYEHFPAHFKALKVGLPESGNGLPDLLNEALWNIDWMLTMQDPGDGGVYHKLTNPSFDGVVMPDKAVGDRVVVQKSTAAALDFAAVMAVGSRVFKDFAAQRPGLSAQMRKAALAAWEWAQKHPDVIYKQPADIHTGDYGDPTLSDEFAWAAAELYITTGDDAFLAAMKPADTAIGVPSWGDVKGLAWISLAHHRERLTKAADRALIAQRVRSLADGLVRQWRASAYGVPMETKDFPWGSSAVALNQAVMLIQADRLTGSPARSDYRDAAQAAFDYVMGRNPLGLSMVTGFGERAPKHPHHRPSEADGIEAPVPGFVVGGPNPGQQDLKGCPVPYPSALPALSYLDHFCSYASNEVAINWNAPLVYVAGALQALSAVAR